MKAIICSLILLLSITAQAQENITFPVTAEVIVDDFNGGAEGIAFNKQGQLFVTAGQALWRIDPEGTKEQLAKLSSNIGLAAIGERDLLVADFGPTNAFQNGANHDGIVWRITPEGEKTVFIEGIGDPNAILINSKGEVLVSDDATNEIFIRDIEGNLKLFSTAVNHPNGIVLSSDEKTLYVAQIFKTIKPVVFDDAFWALKLENDRPTGEGEIVLRTGEGSANDGLAMDEKGRIYIASNRAGKIWRYDPKTGENVLITEGLIGIASMAFGAGVWDATSIYATSTFNADHSKRVWRIQVGVKGGTIYYGNE